MIPPFAQPNDSEGQNERPQEGASGRRVPPDFFAEEAEFAHTLQTAFPLEQEEIPPLFFQTLHGGQEYSLAPRDLEQTIASHVFQRLELPLPPAQTPAQAATSAPRSLKSQLSLRLPHAMGLSALFVVLLLGLAVGVPVLAQMALTTLNQAGRHPTRSASTATALTMTETQQLPWREAVQVVPFTIYWLGQQTVDYAFQSMRLRLDEEWAAGPLVESQYGILAGNTISGRVIVREFQPAVGRTILVTADQRAVTTFEIGGHPAIYVDGRWEIHYEQFVWEYGSQSELLFVDHGLLFWITVQQADGASSEVLQQIADSLEQLYFNLSHHALPDTYVPPTVQLAPSLPPPKLVGGSTRITVSISEQGAPILLNTEQPTK